MHTATIRGDRLCDDFRAKKSQKHNAEHDRDTVLESLTPLNRSEEISRHHCADSEPRHRNKMAALVSDISASFLYRRRKRRRIGHLYMCQWFHLKTSISLQPCGFIIVMSVFKSQYFGLSGPPYKMSKILDVFLDSLSNQYESHNSASKLHPSPVADRISSSPLREPPSSSPLRLPHPSSPHPERTGRTF